MRIKLFAVLAVMFLVGKVNAGIHYSWKDFFVDWKNDTYELYKKRPELKVGIGYDLVRHTPQANGSIPITAWKFLDAGPLFAYETDGSRQVGKGGILFTLRLGRIPLGDGMVLEDLVNIEKSEWSKKYWVGVGPMLDLTGGTGCGFLLNVGWRFF